MKNELRGLAILAATAAVLVLALKLLNWVPAAIEPGTLRKYSDIAALKAGLNIRRVLAPSYFPEDISWPPSLVLGQSSPFEAVVLEFGGTGPDGPALVISQARKDGFSPGERIRIERVMQSVPYELDNRRATLISGLGPDGRRSSLIRWREDDGLSIEVRLRAGPLEILKIARSMAEHGAVAP